MTDLPDLAKDGRLGLGGDDNKAIRHVRAHKALNACCPLTGEE